MTLFSRNIALLACVLLQCSFISTTVAFESSPLFRSSSRALPPKSQSPFHHTRAFQPRNKACTPLNSVLTSVLGAADTFWRTSPYAAAAITCGVKASAADLVAQKRQFHKRTQASDDSEDLTITIDEAIAQTDIRRNVAYLLYGAIYQGMAQEYIYNHIYPVLFGSGVDVVTVLSKVTFDLLLQTTCFTLPIAYMSKALIYRYSFKEAFRRYFDDIRNHGLLTKYFALWGPVQCLTFSVIPEHFRVTFIAMVSFFWLIILSSIASKTPVPQESLDLSIDEECLLEDGLTCNIDG